MKTDYNPGVMANRPRYAIDILTLTSLLIVYYWFRDEYNEEAAWNYYLPPLPDLTFHGIKEFYIIVKVTGGVFVWRQPDFFVELKSKAKDVYKSFLEKTKLMYMGIHEIKLNNSSGVMYPVDNFLKHFYDRYYPKESVAAFQKYKRVNPSLELKLDHLEKFAETNVDHVPVEELEFQLSSFICELQLHSEYSNLKEEICRNIRNMDFEDLDMDLSSAAGYPFPQGVKKRDVQREAEKAAEEMMTDETAFEDYMHGHVWYSTGRAKLLAREAADSGRLILYAGYSLLLIAMLVLQPWSRFMNKYYAWCGVGFSWMNSGAGKFAEYFEANKGYAPKGFRYVSLDISSWDAKTHPEIMEMLKVFYETLLKDCSVTKFFIYKFVRIIRDLISPLILMPLGHYFKVDQGMKSGWGATANDNTLMHELIFRCIMRRLGYMKHVLYGDDNFILVPDAIRDEDIVEQYKVFGFKVKVIHSSRYLGDVDYLSKHVMYCDGYYYVYRDAVETHARLLMPEEMDPRRRDVPDVVIGVERVLGHLLDNPFNTNVRKVCFDLLRRFKEDYGILFIEIGGETLRKHPWRNFDLTKIPKKFPTVPTIGFIEELYGVPLPEHLNRSWPSIPEHIRFNENVTAEDTIPYVTACNFANDVACRFNELAGKQSRALVRKLSPYAQPKECYGFHAARMEFGIKYFGIRFDSLLDFGSHPGACAASGAKYCSDITCVSLKPERDKGAFCPYVARDKNIKFFNMDVNDFVLNRSYDLVHDDVDIVGSRSVEEDVEIGLGMLDRAINISSHTETYLLTLKEVDWRTVVKLYDAYAAYGSIDFVKPVFSNPWKSEFMVCLKKNKRPLIRRAQFNRMVYGFLNSLADELMTWADLLASAITGYKGVSNVKGYPYQTDKYETEWIRPWAYSKEGVD